VPGKVEIVRTSIESWSRGDHDAALAFVDAEIEWRLWRQPWSSLSLELDRVVELDPDHLLALVHFDGVGRDGIRVSREFGQLFTFRALTAAKLGG
jgi:hypothetical protein